MTRQRIDVAFGRQVAEGGESPRKCIATTVDRRAISGEDVPSQNNRETATPRCERPHTEGHLQWPTLHATQKPPGWRGHTLRGQDATQLHTFAD